MSGVHRGAASCRTVLRRLIVGPCVKYRRRQAENARMVTSAEFPPRNQPLLSVKRMPPAAGVGVETAARRRSLAPELVWTSGRFVGWLPADLAARLHTERVTAQEM